MSTILFHRLTLSHLLGATAPFQGPSRDKMFLELDNMASRDSTPLQTWTQKEGMRTVLSGYDRLVTDSKGHAREKGERRQGVIITRRPLQGKHQHHPPPTLHLQESLQDTRKPAEADLPAREGVTHHPPNLTPSYLTFTPISSPKPTLTCLPLPPSSPHPPHTLPTPHPTTRLPPSSAPRNLATSENRRTSRAAPCDVLSICHYM